jgi:hypothetical protein
MMMMRKYVFMRGEEEDVLWKKVVGRMYMEMSSVPPLTYHYWRRYLVLDGN